MHQSEEAQQRAQEVEAVVSIDIPPSPRSMVCLPGQHLFLSWDPVAVYDCSFVTMRVPRDKKGHLEEGGGQKEPLQSTY